MTTRSKIIRVERRLTACRQRIAELAAIRVGDDMAPGIPALLRQALELVAAAEVKLDSTRGNWGKR